MKRLLAAAALALLASSSLAVECPPDTRSCKLVLLTEQEQQILLAPNGILDTAERARFLDLTNYVRYFRDKIASSPNGEIKAPAPPPDAPKPPAEKPSEPPKADPQQKVQEKPEDKKAQ